MQKWGSITRTNVELQQILLRPLFFLTISICLFSLLYRREEVLAYVEGDHRPFTVANLDVDAITQQSSEYTNDPIQSPYRDQFWEVGQRLRKLSQWLYSLDGLNHRAQAHRDIVSAIESVATSTLPFLSNTSTRTPLHDLRSSFTPGSRGIVIPVGGGETAIRFAGHLITSLRTVLDCELPIEVAYAGEEDLPRQDRDRLASLDGAAGISFLDVLSVVDDATLKLAEGGWAVKSFAALATGFEQVIVLDADAVFFQRPEVLFDQQDFVQHGALLFHDRLLWPHVYRERLDWLKDQIKEPSPAMSKSLVWTEEYGEECDSGVVVLDKSRIEVLMGLLHTSWQNTQEVREEVTYKLMYGDKESWWLGLELAGSGYAFESHYGSMLGWEEIPDGDEEADGIENRVCSFTIAHVDDNNKLLWYNGSLLKNKHVDPDTYDIPEAWMMDGKWHKGATKGDMSCMTDAPVIPLNKRERAVLERSIDAAERVDRVLDV